MRSTPTRWIITALVGALALTGCGSASRQEVAPSPEPTTGDRSSAAGSRAGRARYPHTEADVHFMSGMIGHHAQAIVMADWAPTHGASAAVRRLAERIINAQQDEIRIMQQWLRDRGQPVPEPALSLPNGARPTTMKMKMNGHEHEMPMPGMLTETQMQQLDQARGSEFDRLFLTFMVQHHRGAVSMVEDLFGSRGAAQDESVFKLANDVGVDQATEIARMETMLAALPGGEHSP